MLHTSLLILHITAGFTALVSGGISFSAPKGKKLHNASGKIYTLAMIGVGLTAISICLLKYNPFLFTLGIFSTYMTITGYRSLQYYKGTKNPKVQRDWILLVITFLLAGGFTSHMIWTEGIHLMGI